jgi:hypothetical protein
LISDLCWQTHKKALDVVKKVAGAISIDVHDNGDRGEVGVDIHDAGGGDGSKKCKGSGSGSSGKGGGGSAKVEKAPRVPKFFRDRMSGAQVPLPSFRWVTLPATPAAAGGGDGGPAQQQQRAMREVTRRLAEAPARLAQGAEASRLYSLVEDQNDQLRDLAERLVAIEQRQAECLAAAVPRPPSTSSVARSPPPPLVLPSAAGSPLEILVVSEDPLGLW